MTVPGGEPAAGPAGWAPPDQARAGWPVPRPDPPDRVAPPAADPWRASPRRYDRGWPPPTLAQPRSGAAERGLSGLFPSGPPRPTYREPVPVQFAMLIAGILVTTLWMVLFGLVATSARGYAWASIAAAVLAWATAVLLARAGDRGAAVGVAIAAGVGLAVAAGVVIVRWVGGDWLLW